MLKKTLTASALLILLLVSYLPVVFGHNVNMNGLNPDLWAMFPNHLAIDTIAEPQSLDPAWASDTRSAEIIMQVYETLVFFDRIYTGAGGYYQAGKTDQFVPRLAVGWAEQVVNIVSPEGLVWVRTWTFNIRPGVTFQDGAAMQPSDIEYSIERLLVQDRNGGPAWMLYEPLLGVYGAVDPVADPLFGNKIDHAVESNNAAMTVTFNLVQPYPALLFMQILSGTWASVVEQAWATALGDLNIAGVVNGWNNWQFIWNVWHDPAISFIEGNMMGTGPYRLNFFNPGVVWAVTRFAAYWDGWPARVSSNPASPLFNQRIGGFISDIDWNYVPAWGARRARFLATLPEIADMTDVERQFRDMILGMNGVRNWYGNNQPAYLQTLALDAFFFTFDIATTSPYSPNFFPPGVFGPLGIPPDIFSDVNVRKGFAYAFDYNVHLAAAYLGEATQPSDPAIPGLAYNNPNEEAHSFNLGGPWGADYYLRLAWGGVDANNNGIVDPINDPGDILGALWTGGMQFTITYNIGNAGRQTAAQILAANINALNPLFNLNTQAVPWPQFLTQMKTHELPLFLNGWTADFTDPHDFVHPFMHSQGTFASAQGYSNPRADALIETGVVTPDDVAAYAGQLDAPNPIPLFNNWPNIPPDNRWPRRSIYYELQRIYFDDVPSVPIATVLGRHWERDWIRGWYFNPLYGGSLTPEIDSSGSETPANYFYHLWKSTTHFGDANNEGTVNVVDAATVNAHWGGPPAGALGYAPQADLSGGTGGLTGGLVGPVAGIPDGRVTITDVAMVSAYWDGPPFGPSHP